VTSLKWKAFRIANLAQLIGLFAGFLLLLGRLLQGALQGGAFFIVYASGLLVMACTNYFNLHVFYKYFPDRSVPPILKKINTFLLIIGFILSVLLVLIIIVGSMAEFDGGDRSYVGKIALSIYGILLINWVYILCMQIKMFNVIKKESYTSLTRVINSIGQE
jgi:hypothetical protein